MGSQTVLHHQKIFSSISGERSFIAPKLHLPQSTNPMDFQIVSRYDKPIISCWKTDLFHSDGIATHVAFPRTDFGQSIVDQSPKFITTPKEDLPNVSQLPFRPRVKIGLDRPGGWTTLINSLGSRPLVGIVYRPGSAFLASLIGISRNDLDVIPIAIVFTRTAMAAKAFVHNIGMGLFARETSLSTDIHHIQCVSPVPQSKLRLRNGLGKGKAKQTAEAGWEPIGNSLGTVVDFQWNETTGIMAVVTTRSNVITLTIFEYSGSPTGVRVVRKPRTRTTILDYSVSP